MGSTEKEEADAMEWKLLLDDDGHVVLKDGKPVFIIKKPDGTEDEFVADVPGMHQKILGLNGESKSHREKAAELESKLKLFDGIEGDPGEWIEEARKAMETVRNLNDKELVDAGKVEELKQQMTEAHRRKEQELQQEIQKIKDKGNSKLQQKEDQIRTLLVSNKFSQSPYFNGKNKKTNLLPEIAESYFGRHFKVEEDSAGNLRITGYSKSGQPIYSMKNPGELADFDEAISAIIDEFPHKEGIMNAVKPGSGGKGGVDADDDTGDNISDLQKQHRLAIESGDARAAIALKNKIHQAQTAAR
jgi:hypothetical protein